MDSSKKVLVFEYLSCGGIESQNEFDFCLAEGLIAEGFGMFEALLRDFLNIGFTIETLVDQRIQSRFQKSFNQEIHQKKIDFTPISPEGNYISALIELIPNVEYIICIAPGSSLFLFNLIKKIEDNIQSGQLLLNLPSEAIEIFSDKSRTEQYLKHLGFCVPQSYRLLNSEISKLFPNKEYVIKPIDGVGSIDTYCIRFGPRFREHLDRVFLNSNSDFIIQPKFEGLHLSAIFLCRDGKLVLNVINTQNVKFKPIDKDLQQIFYSGGSTPYRDLPNKISQEIRRVGDKIATEYQFTGIFGIDFIYNSQESSYHILDINPRITTPYIGLSELFREENSNLIGFLFLDNAIPELKRTIAFQKDESNKIILN
jgi:predicted ATP-grasp superfamily ATP-dependent carboligase